MRVGRERVTDVGRLHLVDRECRDRACRERVHSLGSPSGVIDVPERIVYAVVNQA
jgi:hypothetical protein